jgi:hypothetical protein
MRYESESKGRAQRAIGALALALFGFAAGFFAGDCKPAPTQAARVCPECPAPRECEAPAPCPAAEVPAPPAPRPARRPSKVSRRLPEASPPDDVDRVALLAWARENTPSLRACSGDPLRATARIRVDGNGAVRDVRLYAAELERDTRACVDREMRRWVLPPALRTEPRELVFAVQL